MRKQEETRGDMKRHEETRRDMKRHKRHKRHERHKRNKRHTRHTVGCKLHGGPWTKMPNLRRVGFF